MPVKRPRCRGFDSVPFLKPINMIVAVSIDKETDTEIAVIVRPDGTVVLTAVVLPELINVTSVAGVLQQSEDLTRRFPGLPSATAWLQTFVDHREPWPLPGPNVAAALLKQMAVTVPILVA